MSTIDSEDRSVTGYFLPEVSQLRLKQLRESVGFLTNLARPRRPDEDSECYNEIRQGEVAICFELIEEQIGQVLDELSWPGGVAKRRRHPRRPRIRRQKQRLWTRMLRNRTPPSRRGGDVHNAMLLASPSARSTI